jgi:hypothetical protein
MRVPASLQLALLSLALLALGAALGLSLWAALALPAFGVEGLRGAWPYFALGGAVLAAAPAVVGVAYVLARRRQGAKA